MNAPTRHGFVPSAIVRVLRSAGGVLAVLLALAIGVSGPVLAATQTPAAVADGPDDIDATTTATVSLRPGEYLWMPELAPSGPVVLVISLPEQLLHVYRNGVRIGVSTVSSGKPGHETPTGVFSILQKRKEHYSNLYNNAPMPFMQRLTWDGIALHAGNLPGYPASHGCVRLPYDFSQKLYGITASGMTVVVANEASHAPSVAYPGWFAPVDPGTGAMRPADATAAGNAQFRWNPELAPTGALTLVLSLADQELVAMRNGVEIGRSDFVSRPGAMRGTHVYVLLDDAAPASVAVTGPMTGPVKPGQPGQRGQRGHRWMEVASISGVDPDGVTVERSLGDGGLQLPPAFAADVHEALQPGTTVVVTSESIRGRKPSDLTVIRADQDPDAPPPAGPVEP